jgi:DNA-binding XRE family transcriptional regulator
MSSPRKEPFVKRRRELNLTQQQIADAVGVSSRTVQRWELGENLPELNILQASKLCQLLRCTIDDLARDFYPEEFSLSQPASK